MLVVCVHGIEGACAFLEKWLLPFNSAPLDAIWASWLGATRFRSALIILRVFGAGGTDWGLQNSDVQISYEPILEHSRRLPRRWKGCPLGTP